jgi:hypothetical protein
MIEEIARHNSHIGILREMADGVTDLAAWLAPVRRPGYSGIWLDRQNG